MNAFLPVVRDDLGINHIQCHVWTAWPLLTLRPFTILEYSYMLKDFGNTASFRATDVLSYLEADRILQTTGRLMR